MHNSDPWIKKYWVIQSGYFRLVITVALCMGIVYRKLLLCHGISEQSKDKSISMREKNCITVYDCSKNTFPVDSVRPYLNLPIITIDASPGSKTILIYL